MRIKGPDLRLEFRRTSAASGPFNGNSSLVSGLLAYWNMNESSGNRVDSVGGLVLVDATPPFGSATGVRGNAAHCVADYMALADNPIFNSVSGAGGFTLNFWLKYVSQSAFAKDDGVSAREWAFFNDGSFYVFQAPGTFTSVTHGATNDGAFHMYTLGWDPADGKVFRYKDNGTVARSGGTIASVANTAAPFEVGRWSNGASYLSGDIDEFGIWSRVLTSAERIALYNGGAGLFY